MKSIEFTCDTCQTAHTIPSSDLEYDNVGSDDRQMGAELYYEASVEYDCDCGNTITIESSFTEYPVGCENDATTTATGGTITKINS